MNVVHIGGNTGGKYTASWTIHPYDDEIGADLRRKQVVGFFENKLEKLGYATYRIQIYK